MALLVEFYGSITFRSHNTIWSSVMQCLMDI